MKTFERAVCEARVAYPLGRRFQCGDSELNQDLQFSPSFILRITLLAKAA
jgi:hypothetical protein